MIAETYRETLEQAAGLIADDFSKTTTDILTAVFIDAASVGPSTSGSRATWVKKLRAIGEACISQAKAQER